MATRRAVLVLLLATVLAACAETVPPERVPPIAEKPAVLPALTPLPREPDLLRVKLVWGPRRTTVAVEVEGPWRIEGESVLELGDALDADLTIHDGAMQVEGIPLGSGPVLLVATTAGRFRLGERWYPGRLEMRVDQGHLALVNLVPFEQYLAGVVASEMPTSFPRDALRAQSVLARSFALSNLGHLTDDPGISQAYRGEGPRTLLGLTASTMGWRLVDDRGRRLPGYWYHSTCGGHTTDVSTVFSLDPVPAYAGVPCGHCSSSRYYRWESTVPEALARKAMGLDTPLTSLAPGKRTPEGRLVTVLARDAAGREHKIAMTRLRGAVGYNRLRSTWVTDIEALAGSDGLPAFRFQGQGWGHGVGLCQIGARGLADEGKDAEAILRHYYPGTRLEKRN